MLLFNDIPDNEVRMEVIILSTVLGIFDSDLEYSSQLMNYIKRKHKSINQIRIFTNKSILYDFLLDNKMDVLLISEDKLQEDIEHDNVGNMCVISEGKYIAESNNSDKKQVIYKFQSAEQIVNELFNYYPILNVKNNNSVSNSKFISIFSLNDSFAKDNFSFNLANQYGIAKKVLLIDLNLLHGRYQLSNLDPMKNLSEFLYFLKSRTPNLFAKMNLQIQKLGNFDYIKGVMFGPDLFDLTFEDLEIWVKELHKSNYDIIIFNIGSYMATTLELFRKSDEIFLVTKDNPWSINLYNNLIEQLNWTGNEDIIKKLERVEIQKGLTDIINEDQMNNVFTDQWGEWAQFYA